MIEKCRRKSCIILVSPLQMANAKENLLNAIIKKSSMIITPATPKSIDESSSIVPTTVAVVDDNNTNLYVTRVSESDPCHDNQIATNPKNVDAKICCTLEMKFIWYAPGTRSFSLHYFSFFYSSLFVGYNGSYITVNPNKFVDFNKTCRV